MPRQSYPPLPPLGDSAHQLQPRRQTITPFTPHEARVYHNDTLHGANPYAIPSDSLDGLGDFHLPTIHFPPPAANAYHQDAPLIPNPYAKPTHSLHESTNNGEEEGEAEMAWITCSLRDCKSVEYHRWHTLGGKANPAAGGVTEQDLCLHPLEGTGWSQEFGISMATGIPSDAFRMPQMAENRDKGAEMREHKGDNGRKRTWDNAGNNDGQASKRGQRHDNPGTQGHVHQSQEPKTMIMTAFGLAAYNPGSQELQYLQQCEAARAGNAPKAIVESAHGSESAEEERPTRRAVGKRRRIRAPVEDQGV